MLTLQSARVGVRNHLEAEGGAASLLLTVAQTQSRSEWPWNHILKVLDFTVAKKGFVLVIATTSKLGYSLEI